MILRNRLPHADWARDNIPKSEINLQYLLELMENYKVPQPYKGVYRIPNLSIENEGFITIVTNDSSGFLGIEYCPPKAATGKNLTGSLNPFTFRNVPLEIMAAFFSPKDRRHELYQQFLNAYRRLSDTTMMDLTNQIDIPQELKPLYLNAKLTPLRWKGLMPQQYVDPKGNTISTAIVFGTRHIGREASCLIYCKYAEVVAHGTLHLYTPAEIEIMKNTLRVEFRFRYQEMKRLGLRDMTKVNSQKLLDVFNKNFDKLTDGTIAPVMPELTLGEEQLVDYWKAGKLDQWKAKVSKRTYFNYKKALKPKGLDIAKPYAETHITTGFAKTIEGK